MKKIGFITTNKVFAQSLATLIRSNAELSLEPYLMHNPQQAALDVEVLGVDVAVVVADAGTAQEHEAALSLCNDLRRSSPCCRILLLVQQDVPDARDAALQAVKDNLADDFMFCDSSLDYLLAKLLAY